MTSAIDLSRLPVPDVIETLDFETILSEQLAGLIQRDETFTALLESDPAMKVLQVTAYRELLLRQRVNEAARAVMLAYAMKNDLDQLGALMNVARLELSPADPANNIAAVMESDEDFRKRIQLAPQGFSVAGPQGAYIFHALGADARVLDVAVSSPVAGQVLVTVLSREGNGMASNELLDTVLQRLGSDDVRPLTDEVLVQSALIIPYSVHARLFTLPGPDATVVMKEANQRIQRYALDTHAIGCTPTLSGIYAALHVAGVGRVELITPTTDIAISHVEAPWCEAIDIAYGGIVE